MKTRWSRAKIVTSAAALRGAAESHAANVVSVDLFDTLVYRAVTRPVDVFYLQHAAMSEFLGSLGASDWVRIRKDAEHALATAAAPKEIQLEDVYRKVQANARLSVDATRLLLDTELAIERDVIKVYADVAAELKRLHGQGIAIAVTTDTYLPADFIKSLTDAFLDFEYTLLCSSATGKTKRSGEAFGHLKAVFPGRRIAHFGDNSRSDVIMASGSGVEAWLVEWARPAKLTRDVVQYAAAIGLTRVVTAADGTASKTGDATRLDDVAWQWSFVLADFMLDVRDYAREIGATDIWFLSRDCETMFQSLTDQPAMFDGFTCRYVYGSRACVYPIVAEDDPALFAAWRDRPANDQDRADGRVARDYYVALLTERTSRVLIVDIGWKGRLQVLLGRLMPPGIELYGYYFALEPVAEPATRRMSRTFVGWGQSVFSQAVVEALSGYVEGSAVRFEHRDGGIKPVTRDATGDRAPPGYCPALRTYLSALLSGYIEQPRLRSEARLRGRNALIQRLCIFPGPAVVSVFKDWSIGTMLDGSDARTLADAATGSTMDKLMGRPGPSNLWPGAAIWSVTDYPAAGRTLQYAIWARAAVKDQLRRRLRRA